MGPDYIFVANVKEIATTQSNHNWSKWFFPPSFLSITLTDNTAMVYLSGTWVLQFVLRVLLHFAGAFQPIVHELIRDLKGNHMEEIS